jgi:diguanylate cyclase (GGDEF)-like protein/PAS domain S-box-containing protein
MREHRSLSTYNNSFWLIVVALMIFVVMFVFYLREEKQVEYANNQRLISYRLADELRQSSDDLTRMARDYVITGKPNYKKLYQEILDIREGRKSRAHPQDHIYWDLLQMDPSYQRPADYKSIPMLSLMREAGFTDAEFANLAEAKNKSDELTRIEHTAMDLVDSSPENMALNRDAALAMLYDDNYMRAKASIMRPIDETHKMMEQRTAALIASTQNLSAKFRTAFIFFIFVFLALLWRAYHALAETMGGTLEEIYQQLSELGQGNFSQALQVIDENDASIKAWIALTQKNLAKIDAENKDFNEKNMRLSRFYNALSQCNQAIVRSHSEQELFEKICHDAVIFGGMSMAWIGMLDEDTQELIPVAHYGDGGEYLDGLQISREPDAMGKIGPVSTALSKGEPVWCQDFSDDEFDFHWHERNIPYGWKSRAILPLHRNGKVVGAFNLFLDQVNAFDDDSRRLLTEMAMDISYALTRFELEMARRHAVQMESLRIYMLERITSSMSLAEILRDVVIKLEMIIPESVCSVMLLDNDGKHIRIGATPHLPDFFSQAINGLEVGPGRGSCGNAIATGRRTIVEDIHTHPYWAPYLELAKLAELGACWSEPIFSTKNQIMGAFAIYHKVATIPKEFHLRLLEMAAHFIAIAVERKKSEDTLSKLSLAVDQSLSAIIITDKRARIEYVNATCLKISGKKLNELIGQRPSFIYNGKAPFATYKDMLTHVRRGDSWNGEWTKEDQNGKLQTDLIHVSPVRNDDGEIINYLIMQEDITEKKRSEEQIQFLAHYDSLTGLPNRTLLEERTRYALGRAARNKEALAVVFFDLDHFKDINDSLGHSFGDELLIQLAKRLTDCLRAEDTISRLGGDEFVLILPGVDSLGAERVVEKLMQVIASSYRINNYDLTVTTSMGIAIYPDDGKTFETLSKNADAAMYRAKREGRNAFRFFTHEMQARSARHLELVNALRYALEHQQLELYYQPQISIVNDRLIGAEALLRWNHHELGSVSPAEFIPIAEDSGLILQLGEWVLRTAVQQLKKWHEDGYTSLRIAVNLSAVQFRHGDLPNVIFRILQDAHVSARSLELELTESVAMHDPEGAISIMNNLSDLGVLMSIDDFGTGYSSLSYLKKFRVYKLKIDRSFVRDIHTDPEDKAIVSAVIGMAKSLGLITIAEGVETADQLDFLKHQGCHEVQGYFYAKPMPASEFFQFMETHADGIADGQKTA